MMLNDLTKTINSHSAYLFFDSVNRFYFTGFKSTAGYLLITKNSVVLYIDDRYYQRAVNVVKNATVKKFTDFSSLIIDLHDLGIEELFIDYSVVTVLENNQFISNGFKTSDCSSVLSKLLSVKREDEVYKIKTACNIAYDAFCKTLSHIKKGVSEMQIKNVLEDYMRDLGAEGTSFDTIVAFGKNTAIPHHETGITVLEYNQPILIDFGAVVGGYASDITRTLFYGAPSSDFISIYDAVLNANNLAEKGIVEGISCKDADKIARDYLIDNGLGEYFTHSLGHGVGLRIHEAPTLSPKSEVVLKNGMVFTVEPGVYFTDKYGVRIEDTCYLINGRVKRLFTDDKKLIVINDKI